MLDFNSEIVFVGDAGTTEASRPSRRIGAEYTLRSKLTPWLWLDLDAAYTRARFLEDDPAAPGRYIPGATEGVVSAALNFDNVWGGWFGGVRVRYFGPRPLIEDNSVRSRQSAPVSARLGYKFDDGLIVRVDGFNLLNETVAPDRLLLRLAPGGRAGRKSTTSTSIRSSRAPSACRCARNSSSALGRSALKNRPRNGDATPLFARISRLSRLRKPRWYSPRQKEAAMTARLEGAFLRELEMRCVR